MHRASRRLLRKLATLGGVLGVLVGACGGSDDEQPAGAGGRGTPPPVVPSATFQDDDACTAIYGTVPSKDSSGSHSFEFEGVLKSVDGVVCERSGSTSATCAPAAGEAVCSFTWRCGSCDYALSLQAKSGGYVWDFGAFEGPPCPATIEIPVRNLCAP